jgi:hypothetical protein
VRRGEIWTASAGGGYVGSPRPVVIVQDDRFDATESVTVCAFTTVPTDAPLLRLLVEADEVTGIRQSPTQRSSIWPRWMIGVPTLGTCGLACSGSVHLSLVLSGWSLAEEVCGDSLCWSVDLARQNCSEEPLPQRWTGVARPHFITVSYLATRTVACCTASAQVACRALWSTLRPKVSARSRRVPRGQGARGYVTGRPSSR